MLRNAVINLTQESHIESTVKIAQLGLPIVYAVIGTAPKHFKPLADAYRKIATNEGHPQSRIKVAAHSWGWIADDHDKAVEEYFYPNKQTVDNIAKGGPIVTGKQIGRAHV